MIKLYFEKHCCGACTIAKNMADGLNEMGMNITIIDACENRQKNDNRHPRFSRHGKMFSGENCLTELSKMGEKILDEREG